MDKSLIITSLAKEKKVEEIVNNILPYKTWQDDLVQDIYIELLEKDVTLLEDLYNKNQLKYYIVRIVKNNVISKTSRYYKKYINYEKRKTKIIEECNI